MPFRQCVYRTTDNRVQIALKREIAQSNQTAVKVSSVVAVTFGDYIALHCHRQNSQPHSSPLSVTEGIGPIVEVFQHYSSPKGTQIPTLLKDSNC